jgi:hypothetical protein
LPGVIVAAGIAWWLWRTVPHDAVRAALAPVRIDVIAAALAAWTACYVTVEVLGFGLAWRAHLVPTLSWQDVATIVCGKMIASPLVPGLTKLVSIGAFWRRDRVPPSRVLGAGELIALAEVVVLLTFATGAILLGGIPVRAAVYIALGAYWMFILGALSFRWASRSVAVFARIGRVGLFAPWTRTTASEALRLLALRAALAAASIACIALILREVGISLNPQQAVVFGALLLFSAFLPVSVGGYGGPQGIAVLVLAHEWNACSPARAVSASLLWASGVLLVQVCVGAVALPRLLALLRRREAWRG